MKSKAAAENRSACLQEVKGRVLAQCKVGWRVLSSKCVTDDVSLVPENDGLIREVEKVRIPLANGHYRMRNTCEEKVRPYKLPPLFASGQNDRRMWENARRPELLGLFAREIYGAIPPPPDFMELELLREKKDALNHTAVRKEIRLHCCMKSGKRFFFDVLLYFPGNMKKKVPVWVFLNFQGNQYYTDEMDVRLTRGTTEGYRRWYATCPIPDSYRGKNLEFANIAEAVRRGYAVATAANGEIFPDHPWGALKSIYTLFYSQEELQPYRAADELRHCGAISAWAWGLSRILDALTLEPAVDVDRAALLGHSRLGKTALWCGANDTRFKLVVSNNSGAMGAALSRRNFGENTLMLAHLRDYWFHEAFLKYASDPRDLPLDQHQLLALIAPRALYVASSSEDFGADPRGEFLALQAAAPVWRLYGLNPGLPEKWPENGRPAAGAVGYHMKSGCHSLTAVDWRQYYDFADKIFNR